MDFKENTKPIYLQIADRICDSIQSGQYPPGQRLPSVREYAAMVQVNANTVMRTYMYLADKQIIYNKRGIGFFAEEEALQRIAQARRESFFQDEAQYFFSQLRSIGITPETLCDMYSSFLENPNNQQ